MRGTPQKPKKNRYAKQRKQTENHMDMGQNPIPMVNTKIAGKWMFIPINGISRD
jgi:hypothetical protein